MNEPDTQPVAEWGEAWLRDWIEDGPAADREQREWAADGWRRFTLDDWAAAGAATGTALDAWQADFAARQHLLLYPRERSGLLVWRAFTEYRNKGLPVPEVILAAFDAMAARLEAASGAHEVAQAIEMTSPKGGPQGAAHLQKVELQRLIVSDVARLVERGIKPAEAYRRVAKERRKTAQQVKLACDRWARSTKRLLADQEDAPLQTLRMLGKR